MSDPVWKVLLRRTANRFPVPSLWLRDALYVLRKYYKAFGEYPNLVHPRTFNEKIAYRKLFDRRPIYTQICDKVAVKSYVEQKLGPGYVPRTLQVYHTSDEFSRGHVQEKCVLKSASGWGDVLVLEPGEINVDQVRQAIHDMITTGHGKNTVEWGYYGAQNLAFLEEYIESEGQDFPVDFKFFVFDGMVEFLAVISGRYTGAKAITWLDREGNHMPDFKWGEVPLSKEVNVDREVLFDMANTAEKLAEGLDMIRVDLYQSKGRTLVGELTAYPEAGLARFYPPSLDQYCGSKWDHHRSLSTKVKSVLAPTWPL